MHAELALMTSDSTREQARPTAIDLFAGAGGATQGLSDAGFLVLGAVEFDHVAASTYRANHPSVKLIERDIRRVSAAGLGRDLGLKRGELTLLKACPPCQGFSSLAEGRIAPNDPRNELVLDTMRFVRALRPQIVMMENVPGLVRDPRSAQLTTALRRVGYSVRAYQVNAADFGVPQSRKRLIIVAIRGRGRRLPDTLLPDEAIQSGTVRSAFAFLAANTAEADELSEPRTLSPDVDRRVRAIPSEGNRFDLPEDLQLRCHKEMASAGKSGAYGSYARLRWDLPSPTMTTRCTTPACGPFLHPEEHRPITLREAATLQTFPTGYKFLGTRGQIERQIGNAVPVLMAEKIAARLLRAARGESAHV